MHCFLVCKEIMMFKELRPDSGNDPYIIKPRVFNMIMDTCYSPELLSMYIFYYAYAKEQNSPYVTISDHRLSRAMDWELSKIKKIKYALTYIGALTLIKEGSMEGRIRVDFHWGELAQENKSKYSCPYGHTIGVSLTGYAECGECDAEINCIDICLELEGEKGLEEREIYRTTE